ncbi:choline transporter-like protein 1 isoform X1 [Homarus americanus]|uniref:choline transporter-like protein 1 isoform X1 n=1 Tax=Homarus americanus TaxID=6706 RepID=UPI001C475DA4|nr:choline transporter-like protein 1 isoform X1 [Homarus americanus]XP_042219078.1 choline transporter-like protein 1 isoform X1 [Homarus americanus]
MGCCGAATRITTARVNGKVLAPPIYDDFDGPLQNRVCRDVVFLILFIAFTVGSIAFLIYVGSKSNPKRLLHGYDKFGNVCGSKNPKYANLEKSGQDFRTRPFLSWSVDTSMSAMINEGAIMKTCVKTCPSNTSTQFLFTCLPVKGDWAVNKTDAVFKAALGFTASDFFETLGQDLQLSAMYIVYLCLISLGLAIVVTVMLRFLAPVVVWLSVFIMVVGTIAGTVALWVFWYLQKKKVQALKDKEDSQLDYEIQVLQKSATTLLISAIVVTIFTVLFLIMMIAMRNRIKLVIALFKEAGKAVGAMPLLLLQPLWTLLWLVLVCLVWVLGWLFIETSGDPKKFKESIVFVKSDFVKAMRWYHIFAFLWVTQFVLACQDVTIAGSVAQWFFTRNKQQLGWPILTAMKRMYRYHLGSLALGSLILAFVKLLRLLLKSLQKQMNSTNQVCAWALKCCQCCLWCFEKFLKFLSRNAYIEIAIYGYGFCKAAQEAFTLLMSNALRVVAINSVGAFVLFLAKLAIVLSTIGFGILMFENRDDVTHVWAPLLIVAIFSYLIAHAFISVYEMTIDALFLCFCEDCKRNDGIQRPYYMSKGLMKFVENNKRALEALEQRQNQEKVWTTNVKPNNGQMYPSLSPSPVHGGMTPLNPAYPPTAIP